MFDRRRFLGAASAGTALGLFARPAMALGAPATDKRFVFIIQRGAADGLATLAPIGDPAFASLRGAFAEDAAAGTKLDAMFALHPSLSETARLYAAKEALFVHAVASPYRDRSHFDGQNVLETGGNVAYQRKDGWLNRLLPLLPRSDARALAVAPTVPAVLRGPVEVSSYAPSHLPDASEDLLTRVSSLYQSDAQLHELWSSAVATRAQAGEMTAAGAQNGAQTGAMAAKLLTGADGARIAVIETLGWDTHANQRGRLAAQLRSLDQMIAALKAGLGGEWANTVVLVATEFGRTAAPNGTRGTDHGTGAMAMLAGGAVAGGRVIADWPGLAPAALYQARDLKPTLDLDSLVAGTLAQHYGLDPQRAMRTLFPDSRGVPFAKNLARA